MEEFKFVAVVLTYRNSQDLIECIDSMQDKIPSCKIVVVNAYYDDETMNEIKEAAITRDCDFINIDNKGYGFGNNAGIEYANTHYKYEYIIISNPDITIDKFDIDNLLPNKIYAPKVITRIGKNQNPMVIKRNKCSEYFVYKGFKDDNKFYLMTGLVLGKISNLIHKKSFKNTYKIYQAHGSFVIIHYDALKNIHPIYDDNMFLFAEEGVLAYKAEKQGIETYFTNEIVIQHKEDGSMSLADFTIDNELKKANIYFYEKYGK